LIVDCSNGTASTAANSSAPEATNLIENGGFETPVVPAGSFTLFSHGQAFTGWKVVGTGGREKAVEHALASAPVAHVTVSPPIPLGA